MRELVLTKWSLEMLAPEDLRAASAPRQTVYVRRAEIPCPELSRFLYTAVSGPWYWLDRLAWTYADWERYLDRAEVETRAATPFGLIPDHPFCMMTSLTGG